MVNEHSPEPQEDIQEALAAMNSKPGEGLGDSPPQTQLSDTLTHSKCCPLLGLRYAFARCGLMAEKYPWQTMAALALTIGCGWLCAYFGFTVLGALILYAIYAQD